MFSTSKSSQNPGVSHNGSYGNNLNITGIKKALSSPSFRSSPAWEGKKAAPKTRTGKAGWGKVNKSRKDAWK